jgi:predicted TIM-barrel fold metal-dependent hydrolase
VNAASTALMERVLDTDSHEMAPSHFWGPRFGPTAGEIADLILEPLKAHRGNELYAPDLNEDTTPITDKNVWFRKGATAPGSFDLTRRPKVLDQMGISRQIVFPMFATVAIELIIGEEDRIREVLGLTGAIEEIRELGHNGLDEYNAWAAAATTDRLRCVPYLVADGTLEDLVGQVEGLIRSGIRTISIPHGVPPAGVSPADPAMDELWALLEKHNVPLVTHIGHEVGFMPLRAWKRGVPAFQRRKVHKMEFGMEPYSYAVLHFAAANFLTVMTLGGVFERFPGLRVGMMEQGSSWLGPLADHLDMWARDVYSERLKSVLSMPPSGYLNRNVRVTPFNEFENVRREFERYPHLSNSYCYSSDYPHAEGGDDSKRRMHEQIAPLGEEVVEKFFVSNGELLLPA